MPWLVSVKHRLLSSLNQCSSMKHLLQIHAQILISGLQLDGFLTTELVKFCTLSPSGNPDHAKLIIHQSQISIRSSWNMLIRGFVNAGRPKEAIFVYLSMRGRQVTPSFLTFPFLFKACAAVLGLEIGQQVHAELFKHGLDSDVFLNNSLIHCYGACSKVEDARKVFDEMFGRTIVSWNSIICACAGNVEFVDAFQLFFRMRDDEFEGDDTTMVIMFNACADSGNLVFGKCLHVRVMESGMVMNCQLGTAIVDMYAKCGAVDCALSVFERMRVRNVWTWSAMILGLAQHGSAEESLKLFRLMTSSSSSVVPNYVTFLGVLSACSHAGLVEDGYRSFHDMQSVYGIVPRMMHYSVMVDILGRAGRLNEAYSFIMEMPIVPDPVVWRTLLSACIIHEANDSQGVGDAVRHKLLEMEPERGGNLVMVANKYVEAGMFEKSARVWEVMKDLQLKKRAAESSVAVDGSLHGFHSGW